VLVIESHDEPLEVARALIGSHQWPQQRNSCWLQSLSLSRPHREWLSRYRRPIVAGCPDPRFSGANCPNV
jgi:hypothetical protein